MPRSHIPIRLRRLVIQRASGRCEYCLINQEDRPETHPIDHVIALKHGGRTVKENLALACAICDGAKGSENECWRFTTIGGICMQKKNSNLEAFGCISIFGVIIGSVIGAIVGVVGDTNLLSRRVR
jgi:hypothetical protein